jgi:hypothetical protein
LSFVHAVVPGSSKLQKLKMKAFAFLQKMQQALPAAHNSIIKRYWGRVL